MSGITRLRWAAFLLAVAAILQLALLPEPGWRGAVLAASLIVNVVTLVLLRLARRAGGHG